MFIIICLKKVIKGIAIYYFALKNLSINILGKLIFNLICTIMMAGCEESKRKSEKLLIAF
jgi:hypothetical protein